MEISIFAEIAISAPPPPSGQTDGQTLADLDGAGLRAGGVHGAPESRGAARLFPPFSFIFFRTRCHRPWGSPGSCVASSHPPTPILSIHMESRDIGIPKTETGKGSRKAVMGERMYFRDCENSTES